MRAGVDVKVVIIIGAESTGFQTMAAAALGEGRAARGATEEIADHAVLVDYDEQAIFAFAHHAIGTGGQRPGLFVAPAQRAHPLHQTGHDEIAAEQIGRGDELIDGEERIQRIQLRIAGDVMVQVLLGGGGILIAIPRAIARRAGHGQQDQGEANQAARPPIPRSAHATSIGAEPDGAGMRALRLLGLPECRSSECHSPECPAYASRS